MDTLCPRFSTDHVTQRVSYLWALLAYRVSLLGIFHAYQISVILEDLSSQLPVMFVSGTGL